jgi:PBSX family phage terminase large subunit
LSFILRDALSTKQIITLHESNARINILEGSVRSGKSFIALLRFLKELKEGPSGEYIIVGKSERTVLHNVIDPLQRLTGGIIRYNRGLGEFTLFGRKVYVVGANDERAEGKIRGSTFAGALVDEISIIPHSFFRMLLSRLSIDGAKLFGTTNPDSPYHWLKADFIDNENVTDKRVFSFRLEDNPSLSQSFINNLKREYKGLWYKRFIDGLWVLAEGAIYDFFDETIHVVETAPTYGKYYILGVDYGTTNPFACVLIGYNDDHHPSVWVEKEYYWDSKKMGYQKSDTDYANDVRREFGDYPLQAIYLDPSAASFEVELRRAKQPVRQAKNEVIDGIRFVANLFTNGDLVVRRGCIDLIKEIEGYVWDTNAANKGKDQPLKVRDHAVDAMRYALYTHFGHRDGLAGAGLRSSKPVNPMNYTGYGPNSIGWQRY